MGKKTQIRSIRSDRGGEFLNELFEEFCDQEGIRHQFLTPRTPQQNRVAEKRNMPLVKMGRTLLNDNGYLTNIGAKLINTSC